MCILWHGSLSASLSPPFVLEPVVSACPCLSAPACLPQLEFFQALFATPEGLKLPLGHARVYSELSRAAAGCLQRSAYHVVDAAATFGYIEKMRRPGAV